MLLRSRRLFVSHSSNDDAFANVIVERLAAIGLKPFVDHHPKTGIIPGEDWLQALRRDVKATQAVLILVSDAWRLSQWCQAEYRTAKLLGKPVIPVILGGGAHDDIEPTLQKIVLANDASAIPNEAVQAIARALPSRTLENTALVTVFSLAALVLALGFDALPFGRWRAAEIKGGAFVGLAHDPKADRGLFALSNNSFGRAGLFSSADCGGHWSEVGLPAGMADPNRLDVSADEIFIATDDGFWILNRASQKWLHVNAEGLSEEVLVARVSPGRPDQVIYGTRKRGGMQVSVTIAAAGNTGNPQLTAKQGGGGGTAVLDRTGKKVTSFSFQMNDIAFNPRDPQKIVVAAANNGVFISFDGLQTAQKLDTYKDERPLEVTFDPKGETAYVSGLAGLSSFKFPADQSEKPEVRRLLTLQHGEAHSLTFAPDGRLYLASTEGLFSASSANSPFEAYAPEPSRHINKVVGCGQQLLVATGGGGVLASAPGSPTWRSSLTSAANLTVYSGLATNDFQVASAGPFLFRSLDGGHTFENVATFGATVTNFVGLEGEPGAVLSGTADALLKRSQTAQASRAFTEHTVLAGLGDGRIMRKASGSTNWSPAWNGGNEKSNPTPVNTIAKSATDRATLIAALQSKKPLISKDGGVHWREIESIAPDQAMSAFALEDGWFLLSGDADTVRYLDPRTMAIVVAQDKVERTISAVVQDPARKQTLAVDIKGNVYAIDGAKRLTRITSVIAAPTTDWIDSFCCDDRGAIYIGGKAMGVWRSSDGGHNFQRLTAPKWTASLSAYAVGPGPGGMPSIYSDEGLLQASHARQLCLSDTRCIGWSVANIEVRLRSAARAVAAGTPWQLITSR